MKKSYSGLIVLMVAACCYLSHVTAIETTAAFIEPPYDSSRCFDEADKRTLIVYVGKSLWNNGANCGKKMRIFCMGPVEPEVTKACNRFITASVDVVIADTCEDCESDFLYLSKEAFEFIAYEEAGRVKVGYMWIS